MKFLTIVLFFTVISTGYAKEMSFEDRLELAQKAIMLHPPKEVFMTQSSAAKHPLMQQIITKADFDAVNAQAAEFMANAFTFDELKALLNFQGSAIGQSIAAKMPQYQRLVGAIIQKELQDTLRKEMQGRQINPMLLEDYNNNPNQTEGGGSPVRQR